MFVNRELRRFKKILSPDPAEYSLSQKDDEEGMESEAEKQESSAREGVLKITLSFLRNMNQKELADSLERSKCSSKPLVL